MKNLKKQIKYAQAMGAVNSAAQTGEGNAPRVSKSSELCKEAMLLGKNQAWAFSKLAEAHDKVTAQRDELLAALKAIVSFQDEVLNEIDEDRDLLTDADIDREQSAWVLARRAIKTADKPIRKH